MSAATHDPSLTIFAPSRATSYASNRAVTPNTFSGTIEVTLGRAATLSKLTIALVGRVSGQMDPNGSPMTREMCQVSRRLARNTRLKIGVNSIRFNIHPMPSNLPPTSTHVGHQGDHGFSVTYELIARAKISYCCLSSKRRTEASVPVHMLLEHDCTGPAFVSPVQAKGGQEPALSYELTLPHRSWAAGTSARARVVFHQTDPGCRVKNISAALVQSVSAAFSGREYSTRNEIATGTTLSGEKRTLKQGDHILELIIPTSTLPSYENGVFRIRITHDLALRIVFVDGAGRHAQLVSAVPITVLAPTQAIDAQRASAASEAWLFGSNGQWAYPGMLGYPTWGPLGSPSSAGSLSVRSLSPQP